MWIIMQGLIACAIDSSLLYRLHALIYTTMCQNNWYKWTLSRIFVIRKTGFILYKHSCNVIFFNDNSIKGGFIGNTVSMKCTVHEWHHTFACMNDITHVMSFIVWCHYNMKSILECLWSQRSEQHIWTQHSSWEGTVVSGKKQSAT